MQLGGFCAAVVTIACIAVAVFWDYHTMPDAFRNLFIFGVVTLVAASALGLLTKTRPSLLTLRLSRFIFMFCVVMAPGALTTAIVCFSTGQAKWGGTFLFWAAASAGGGILSQRLTRVAETDHAYQRMMTAMEQVETLATASVVTCPDCGATMSAAAGWKRCPRCGRRLDPLGR
jgi:predicted RNA-binding Zn-ribbon protein involved in translation (DUF1610 family)